MPFIAAAVLSFIESQLKSAEAQSAVQNFSGDDIAKATSYSNFKGHQSKLYPLSLSLSHL